MKSKSLVLLRSSLTALALASASSAWAQDASQEAPPHAAEPTSGPSDADEGKAKSDDAAQNRSKRSAGRVSGADADVITVTGTRIGAERRAPSPISIVTAEEIEKKQVTNMTDLLRGEIPGIFVINPGMYDWTTQVYSRGTTVYNFGFSDLIGDYSKIFVDGIELARPTLLSMLDPRTIERIETVRGPQAGAIYGSEGSSGLLKIVTKKGSSNSNGRLELVASASAGIIESSRTPEGVTPWVQDHSLQLYGGDDDFGYRIGGSYQSAGEWTPNYDSRTWGLSGGLRARRGDFTLSLSALHFDRKLSVSAGVDYPMIETLVAATIGYQATPNWQHTLTLGSDKNRFSYSGVSFGENTLQATDYSRRTLRYFTSYDAKIGSDFSAILTAGADATFYHSDMIEAYGFNYVNGKPNFEDAWVAESTQDNWSNYGYYGMAEFGYRNKLFLTVAGRVEEGLRWVAPSERRQFQPRVGLSYVLDRGPATLKLRGQWGRSARAPIMDVREATGYRPNPHLGPDIKEGWDAGFDLTWRGLGTLSVTYFDEEGRNLLMPVTVQTRPTIREYQNIGMISNKGWEIEGSATIGPVSLRGNVIVPDNRWVQGSSPTDRRVGTRIASTPQYSGGGTVSLRVLDGSVSANAYVLKMRDRDAVKRLNLRAEKPITDSLTVFARVDNVLNDQDSERYTSSFYVTPGRTTVLGVRKTLGLGASNPVFARSGSIFGGGGLRYGSTSTTASGSSHSFQIGYDPTSSDIIVTAPYERDPIDLLSGTSVLSGTELTRQLRSTIGETLARQPGVSATSFGPNASRPVLRGFQGERIRVLSDGIGGIDVSNTSVDHAAAINPLTAERIEVLRGPASLLFGSSAIGGVVNVIDNRIPRRLPQGQADLDVITNYGSAANETSISGVINMPVTQNIVFHVDGSYLKTDDLRTGGYLYTPSIRAAAARVAATETDLARRESLLAEANSRGKLTNSAAETSDYAAGLSYIGDGANFGFSVSRYNSLYGVPARFDPEHYEEEGDDGHGHAGHSHSGVRLDLKQTRVDVRGEFETSGFFDRIRVRAAGADYKHDEIESRGDVGTSFYNKGYEGRLEAVQAERDGWKGAIGGQFFIRNFRVVGEEKFLPKSNSQQYGLFTLQSFDFGMLKAEAGARFEHSDISADADADLGNGNIDRRFNAFSVSAGGSLPVADGIRVGLNASRTERAPSAEEMFANGPHIGTQAFEIGDPNFRKEASWGLEGTLKGRGEGYSFSASIYHNWFSNYIYDYQTGGTRDGLPVYQYTQAAARYFGIEGEISARLARIGAFEIRGDVLGDYVRATIEGSGPAPRIPPLRLLGGVELQSARFGSRVEVERAFKQDRISAFETPTNGYTMVNASVNWRPFAGNATSLLLSVNNLFDVEARRHSSVLKDYAPLAGRDARLTARFQF